MTGEVIIQLPRYCLYTVIWLEKSSSRYPDTVSILSYDWRSHHPATQIMSILTYDRRSHHPATRILSLYCHMTGEVIIQLPRYCLYTVKWQEKSSSSYPIMSLYCHITGEVIILLPRYCLYTWWLHQSYVSIAMIWVAGWWPLQSYDSIDMIWAAGWWLLLSYDSIETVSG
jgi:hypothetical protein